MFDICQSSSTTGVDWVVPISCLVVCHSWEQSVIITDHVPATTSAKSIYCIINEDGHSHLALHWLISPTSHYVHHHHQTECQAFLGTSPFTSSFPSPSLVSHKQRAGTRLQWCVKFYTRTSSFTTWLWHCFLTLEQQIVELEHRFSRRNLKEWTLGNNYSV